MSNIIDSIRLSGTTYQIQGSGGGITVDPTLDSGSTNPVANSAITTALDDKVNVADNNASAYTFENKISGVEYGYSEHFAGPLYIRYTGSTSSSGDYYAGNILCYISEWGWDNIYLDFNLSNGQITATTVSSNYFDIEIENGEAALTFKDGYYLRQYISQNNFVALTKTTYESGQSADVIEDTVYDVFDKLNDKIDKTSANVVTGSSLTFSDGYLNSHLRSNKTNLYSSVKIDSSTIKSGDNGLSVQFATPEVADKILNVGSGSYGTLFSTGSYNTSFNEFTITFNPNCTQYNVYNFSVRIIDASNAMYDVSFEYDSSDMSAVYTNLSTYCTVTYTLLTDYKFKVTAKEGYKIARLYNSEYMVGGVDNTTPNDYISNLVTTPSYVHDGQDVIDDIYDKLDDKQDTLQSGTNIKTINNESILGSGNIDIQSGGKAIEAGRGISITTGETADTVSFNLPISAGTGTSGTYIAIGVNAYAQEGYNSFLTNAGGISIGSGSSANRNSIIIGNGAADDKDRGHGISIGTGAKSKYGSISIGEYSESSGTTYEEESSIAIGYRTTAKNVIKALAIGTDVRTTGTTKTNINNQLKIDTSNQVYIYNKDNTEMICLQDHLGGGGGGTVESTITSGSTNAVQSKAIWSATTYNKGVLLTFGEFRRSINYPNGCTKLIVEAAGFDNMSDIDFFNDDQPLGHIHIDNRGDVINVEVRFDGASYEISGTTVIITYPTVTVTKIRVDDIGNYVYKAIVEGAWVNENTYMKPEVDAIASGLQNNINSKLDATAYTPTVVDSALNVASTNPVQNQALYSELRIDNGETETTLTFEDNESTNYPNGCTKLNVEVAGSDGVSDIRFFNDDEHLGHIHIDNRGDVINVEVRFDGASYEISGTTVIITYPTVTNVTKIEADGIGNYVYKAITSLTTPLKDKVAANTTALGGLKLVKLTQAEYKALATKDNSTLYVIVN